MNFECTHCGSPCPIGGDTTILFHPDGEAGALCSRDCVDALRLAHPELVHLLGKDAHGAHAMAALRNALIPLRRARGSAIGSAAMPFVNAALFLASAPVRMEGYGAAEHIAVLDAALDAKAPLRQSVLHLCALQSHGMALRDIVSAVGGCDVAALGDGTLDEAERLDAMADRVESARKTLEALGFRLLGAARTAPKARSDLARSTRTRYHGLILLAVVGTLAATCALLLGARGLARTPSQDRPLVVPCGSQFDHPAGTWLRLVRCRADVEAAVQRVRTNARTQVVESRGSIFVPLERASAPRSAIPWAYLKYESHRDPWEDVEQSAFQGVLDGEAMNGRVVIVEGHSPVPAQVFYWSLLAFGVAAGMFAGLLGRSALARRRPARDEPARAAPRRFRDSKR